jgi:hypothetical protein
MGYSEDDSIVRCDFFNENGKWKYTVALNMRNFYDADTTYQAVEYALKEQYPNKYTGLWYVVLEPYHKNSHPQMGKIP